jgi:hypothetical protein
MATIKLTDEFSVPQPIDIPDTSVLGRSPESVIHFVKTDVLKVLDTPIDKVDLGSAAVGHGRIGSNSGSRQASRTDEAPVRF